MVGLALVAPAATHSAAGDKKVTFTMAGLEKVDNFNPFKGYQAITYEAWALMYDYLVGYKMSDMSPTPELATSWDTSNDGLTWTFHMRSGLKWSDGKPLTAADVAYTFTRVLNGSAENLQWGTYLKTVKTATAPDDTTVVLKLSKPMATLPLLPIPIIPEHIWKNVSEADMKTYDNEPSPGHPIVGSGPFELTSGTSGGSTYTFERNPYFWGPKPHVDEVVFRVYESPDPMVQALIKGEVDFVEGINGVQVDALQGKPDIAAHNGVSPLFEHIGFNTGAVDLKTGKPMGDGNPALKDPKFRHALGFGVDRERIASNAFQGQGIPGQTIIPDFYTRWHWDPPADQAFKFSISTAGQMLDDAGYKKGSDGLRTMPDGSPLGTLRLYARSSEKTSVNTMDFVKEWLGELGIKSTVKAMDSGQLGDVILQGNYDMFQWDWYVEPDPDSILADLTCGQRNGLSDTWFCDKKYDELYAKQGTETDVATRQKYVDQMQQIAFENAPYVVLLYPAQGEAFRTDQFGCFRPQPEPDGVWLIQYGGYNYTFLRPADQAGNCDGVSTAAGAASSTTSTSESSSSSNTAVLIIGGVLILLLLAGGGIWAFRRRSTAAERE